MNSDLSVRVMASTDFGAENDIGMSFHSIDFALMWDVIESMDELTRTRLRRLRGAG